MMGRLRESKWVYVLLSVLLAVLFWFYVRAEVDPTQPYTIHNVRVELTGTNVLTSQGLTVAGLSTETVNLRIEAPTSVAANLLKNRSNLYIPLDVSRCVEGENELSYKPSYPANVNVSDVTLQEQDPATIIVTVDKLYTSSIDVEFQLKGQVAENYQMGTAAVSPESVTVSGSVEQVSQVAKVVAILEDENLDERFAGDLPLTLLDREGNPLTDLDVTLSADSAYVVVPVVVQKDVGLTVNVIPGGGATADDAVIEIEPDIITVTGPETDIEGLEEISLGSVDLSKVVGTKEYTFPITLDPGLENVSGITSAKVTVKVDGLSTATFEVGNITVSQPPDGYTAESVTQNRTVTIRGRTEDLEKIDASQIRIVADVSEVTTTGLIPVTARVYLDAGGSVGVIGDYSIVVNVSRS